MSTSSTPFSSTPETQARCRSSSYCHGPRNGHRHQPHRGRRRRPPLPHEHHRPRALCSAEGWGWPSSPRRIIREASLRTFASPQGLAEVEYTNVSSVTHLQLPSPFRNRPVRVLACAARRSRLLTIRVSAMPRAGRRELKLYTTFNSPRSYYVTKPWDYNLLPAASRKGERDREASKSTSRGEHFLAPFVDTKLL